MNKQPHDHYLHQMYEKLDRDIERLVVSKDEEKKEKHVKYVTDWLTASESSDRALLTGWVVFTRRSSSRAGGCEEASGFERVLRG